MGLNSTSALRLKLSNCLTIPAAFGLGTVPALFLAANLADLITVKSRLIIYRIGAVLMIIAGVYFIVNAARV